MQAMTLARFTIIAAFLGSPLANATHVVYSPIVEYGETEIELMADVVNDSDSEADGNQTYYLEFSRGFTRNWASELLVEFEHPDGEGTKAEALEWENVIQLSEQGAQFIDYGLFFEVEKALEDGSPDELVVGILLEQEFGHWVARYNLFAEKEVGENHESGLEGKGSLQVAWRKYQMAMPALEYYSSEYENSLGTLVNGKWKAGKNKFGYSVGILWGLDDDTPDQTLRTKVEFEF